MTISVRLDPPLVVQLDRIAAERRMTRSDLLREQAARVVAEHSSVAPDELPAILRSGPKPRYSARELMRLTRGRP